VLDIQKLKFSIYQKYISVFFLIMPPLQYRFCCICFQSLSGWVLTAPVTELLAELMALLTVVYFNLSECSPWDTLDEGMTI